MHTVSRTLRVIALGLLLTLFGTTSAMAAPAGAATGPGRAAPSAIARAVSPSVASTGTAASAAAPVLQALPAQADPPELVQTPGLHLPNNRVMIGIIAVVLFGIVFYGRKIRKARKKNGGGGA